MFSDIGVLQMCAVTGVIVLATTAVLNWLKHKQKSGILRQKATEKRKKERDYISSQLETLSQQLNQTQSEEILKLPAPDLIQQMQKGELKPDDVLRSYLHKACHVTASLNCVTEVIRSCEDDVRKLAETKPENLPLYGLPVSLKESMETKDSASTLGLSKHLDNIAEEDCVLAKVLKHCGAVPFVKTNLPQTTISFESSNPIYGATSNPHNPDFTPGGSSSGEGSIVGAGASPLGFGTDTGGSIRCPSHMCGICGLKPTPNRISLSGVVPPFGLTTITTSAGPMARDVDTLVAAMRALLCDLMFKLDPSVPPIKFREEMYASKRPMRIGYYDDDGYIKPIPACQRAVNMVKDALEKAGHTLVPFRVPDTERMMRLVAGALFIDSGKSLVEQLEDDEVDEVLQAAYKQWTAPRIVRRINAAMMGCKSSRAGTDIMACGGGNDPSAYNLWKIRGELEDCKSKFWAEWREKYNIEAMIAPAYPIVACPKGSLAHASGLWSYTVLYNMLSGSAGVVPVTKVTQKDIDDLKDYEGHYGDDWDQHIKTACLGSINMPVAVQCISSTWNDETCLRLMKEVETLMGNWEQ